MKKWFKNVVVVLVLAAALISVYTAYTSRIRVEKNFRQVEMAVSYLEIANLAGVEGLTPAQGLTVFKNHGVNGVVLQEPMLEDLRVRGYLEVFSGRQLSGQLQNPDNLPWISQLQEKDFLKDDRTYIVTYDQAVLAQLQTQLEAKLKQVELLPLDGGPYVIRTVAPYAALASLGAGFTPESLREVQATGMNVFIQVRTWPGASEESIKKVFQGYRQIPHLAGVMFNDDTVPGYPGLLPVVADEVQALGVPVVAVEFYPQRGLSKLGVLVDKNVLRLHTVPEAELKRLSPAQAVDRYVLAATDRNHRLLYFRPFTTGGETLASNAGLVDKISQRLQAEGLVVGNASELPPLPVSRLFIFIAGLGVIGGALLLLEALQWRRWLVGLGLLGLVGWAGLLYLDMETARKLMALGAVLVYPTLAMVTVIKPGDRESGEPAPAGAMTDFTAAAQPNPAATMTGDSPWLRLLGFVKMSAIALIGALLVVGLLPGAAFMLKLNQFAGVKLAHVIPLLVVLVYFGLGAARGDSLRQKLRAIINQPLVLGVALAALVLVAAVGIYVLRTGNEGMPISGLELQFRALLDQFLGVRPRTKEFLIGHPAMVLLLLFGYRDNRFLPLLLLGAIGQISMVNTFAHIHTPLAISIWRTFNGLWLGVLLGLIAYGVIIFIKNWWEKEDGYDKSFD